MTEAPALRPQRVLCACEFCAPARTKYARRQVGQRAADLTPSQIIRSTLLGLLDAIANPAVQRRDAVVPSAFASKSARRMKPGRLRPRPLPELFWNAQWPPPTPVP